MTIKSIKEAIALQVEVDQFLVDKDLKNLVGEYGEVLIATALKGKRQTATTQGYDIQHKKWGRIEVKTRKYELKANGVVRKEDRAVGFANKKNGFDWMAHVILDTNYKVIKACLAKYSEIWPEIQLREKISFKVSSSLISSIDISQEVKEAEKSLE